MILDPGLERTVHQIIAETGAGARNNALDAAWTIANAVAEHSRALNDMPAELASLRIQDSIRALKQHMQASETEL